jgi:hypothetical protein
MRRWRWGVAIGSLLLLVSAQFSFAQNFTSQDFSDANPVITVSGGYATSSHFQVYSGSGQTVIGESSGTQFKTRSGFFYFPLVTSPVLTANAGTSRALLSWSAAVGSLGFNVSSYQVGKSTANGGPYSYTVVGNVLSYTASGLNNGQAYFFVVQALDAFGTVVATSNQSQATPTANAEPSPSSGSPGIPETNALLKVLGETAPNAVIHVLRNGIDVGSVVANGDGSFTGTVSGQGAGQAIFTVYSVDKSGNHSASVSFLLTLEAGKTTTLGPVFLPPIVTSDKTEVRTGDGFSLLGSAQPGANITILSQSGKEVAKVTADANGRFIQNFSSDNLPEGLYTFTVRSDLHGRVSEWSQPISVRVGKRTVETPAPTSCPAASDFNHDCHVNLVDFSILIYWFDHPNPPPEIDLNQSGTIDLADFSILMYYWTG